METINDRLNQIKNAYFDGNQRAFAAHIGLPPGSISNYLNKGSKPGLDVLERIVNSLDVDAMWLLTGNGEMKRNSIMDPAMFNSELINLCKALISNYQQRDEVMSRLISMVNQIK